MGLNSIWMEALFSPPDMPEVSILIGHNYSSCYLCALSSSFSGHCSKEPNCPNKRHTTQVPDATLVSIPELRDLAISGSKAFLESTEKSCVINPT